MPQYVISRSTRSACRVALVAAGIGCLGVAFVVLKPSIALAQSNCTMKAAEGTGGTEKTAKFQVYEALLQATDWGAWAAWMANGTTPGYSVGPVKYRCAKGTGLGYTCRGQAKICKL